MSDLDLNQRVKELIPNDVEREKLFDCLQDYKSYHDLDSLLFDLRLLLNEPNRLELYDYMRPVILLQHQIEYSRRAPAMPGVKMRTVRLYQQAGEKLGFAVRGGFEHNVGIFVTEVSPGSQAERQGLKVGDEVVRINGFTIAEAIHEDVLSLIKSRDEVTLKVTYIGMLPVKGEPTDPVTWEHVDSLDEQESKEGRGTSPDLKIFIDSTGHASIGCSILSESGPSVSFPGIFVEKVRSGSIAEQVGLEPGDQIMEVNETSFRKISWEKAVLALKSSRQLSIVIRKKAGSKFIQRWSSSLATAGREDQYSVPEDTSLPASPLGLSDVEPIYSTVNKVNRGRQAEAFERRTSESRAPSELSELELIEQQLNRKLSSQLAPSLSSDEDTHPKASHMRSHSPALSKPAIIVSTESVVHPNTSNHSSRSADDRAFHQPRPALGGAAALMAERRLHTNGSKAPGLLGPADDYEWSDNVRGRVYDLFNSDSLDGRRLVSLTYNKNADLGIDIEGGLGSPLGGKILVAVLLDGGIAQRSGKFRVGDQLMMINGQMLLGVTTTEAERIIHNAAATAKDKIELFYCESTLVNDESTSTYF